MEFVLNMTLFPMLVEERFSCMLAASSSEGQLRTVLLKGYLLAAEKVALTAKPPKRNLLVWSHA